MRLLGGRDPYMKLVPPEAAGHKDGGMNVLIWCDYNVAGNATFLCETLNLHTIHKCRYVVVTGDYLDYGRDVLIVRGAGENEKPDKKAIREARELVKRADFFHIMRIAQPIPGVDWSEMFQSGRANKNNTLIQYFGSVIRTFKSGLSKFHQATGITQVNYADYSMLRGAGEAVYHIPLIWAYGKLGTVKQDVSPVRICHAPTSRNIKRTDVFLAVMERVKKRYDVEVELIEGVSHEECLQRKLECQICFDSLNPDMGLYGLTAMESWAMAQPVLCGINGFTLSMWPDCPAIRVVPQTLEDEICKLLEMSPAEREAHGKAAREWLLRVHDPVDVAERICRLYDVIMNGPRNVRMDDKVIL